MVWRGALISLNVSLAILAASSLPVQAASLTKRPFQLRSLSLLRSLKVRANDSFLRDTTSIALLPSIDLFGMPLLLGNSNTLSGVLMEERRAAELRQQYSDMTREYENREKFGLLAPWERMKYEEQVRGFSQNVFNQVRDRQMEAHSKRMEGNLRAGVKNERKGSGPQVVATSAVVMGAVVALVSGQPVDVKISPEVGFTNRFDLRGQNESLRFYSPLLQSELSFSANAPDRQDMSQGAGAQGERFKLTLGHQLPIWSLTAGLTAGSSSRTVQATLTKQITPEISMVWGSTGALERPDWNQQTFTLQYGVSF